MDTIIQILARELGRSEAHVENVVRLIDEGNTIPFIARYRKELHGAMDDTALRTLADRLQYLRNLDKRREEVKSAIEGQGKLTEELSAAIDAAATLAEVEDLYRPYKQKRRTRATVAREKGLEPLAELLFAQAADGPAPEEAAGAFIDPEKGVETAEDALQGASDIIAERISDDADIRKRLRELVWKKGSLVSAAAAKEPEDTVYRLYYAFRSPLNRVQGHQVLAINRGEREGVLKVSVEMEREAALIPVRRAVLNPGAPAMAFVRAAAEDAYDRLIFPSVEREMRSLLTEQADEGAIKMFGLNLKPLLMQPPVKGFVTMGLDPGYRNGCKVAVVDATGKVLDTAVVYPTFSQRKKEEAIDTLAKLIRRHGVAHIAIGNGTASRETEQMTVELIRRLGGGVSYMIVNEAGASVYSASKLAAEEFPDYDVNLRSAVSIARRLQDPLAELVKIDPKAIGVGQYQHDMPQARLGEALDGVVGLRQCCWSGCEYRVALPAPAGVRSHSRNRPESGEVPGGARGLHRPEAAAEGAQAGSQGVRAVRRLPPGAGEPLYFGPHRRPSGELWRGGKAAGRLRLYPDRRGDRRAGGAEDPGGGHRTGPAGGDLRRGRPHPGGHHPGADEARTGPPG